MECLAPLLEQKFPQFNTVSPQHSLRDAVYQMSYENLDYLIVQEGSDFVGLLTEHDVAHKLFGRNKPPEQLKVKDIMNCSVPVGSLDDTVEFAIEVLSRYSSRYIAVFGELEFKGIVSETDLLQAIVASAVPQSRKVALQEPFDWSY